MAEDEKAGFYTKSHTTIQTLDSQAVSLSSYVGILFMYVTEGRIDTWVIREY